MMMMMGGVLIPTPTPIPHALGSYPIIMMMRGDEDADGDDDDDDKKRRRMTTMTLSQDGMTNAHASRFQKNSPMY